MRKKKTQTTVTLVETVPVAKDRATHSVHIYEPGAFNKYGINAVVVYYKVPVSVKEAEFRKFLLAKYPESGAVQIYPGKLPSAKPDYVVVPVTDRALAKIYKKFVARY